MSFARTWSVVGVFLVFCTLAAPADALNSFLTPLGSIAEAQRAHLLRVVGITMIAIVPVLIGVPLILWRYRRKSGGTYRPEWEYSRPLELTMWGVPIAIICVLGVWLWQSTHRLDPYATLGSDPLEVQVIGLDWKWLFIYPEQGIATVGEMAIPVGRPVTIKLTTDTVMQSFLISALAGQIYAMPGMITQLNLVADRVGTTEGENTQYNGDGFVHQKFTLKALSDADWGAWVTQAHASGLGLDAQSYATLGRRGTLADAQSALAHNQNQDALLFDSVPQGFFHGVMHRYHSGEPLAPAQQPGAPAYESENNDG